MQKAGGFRYVVSLSLEPEVEPYAGMEELYFPDEAAWQQFRSELEDDGINQYVARREIKRAGTEMVGIP
jgi:hypothetical protein